MEELDQPADLNKKLELFGVTIGIILKPLLDATTSPFMKKIKREKENVCVKRGNLDSISLNLFKTFYWYIERFI